ncbi:MAG: hypothetical protein WCH99_00095 [Verrucomicrobiota bacterium]
MSRNPVKTFSRLRRLSQAVARRVAARGRDVKRIFRVSFGRAPGFRAFQRIDFFQPRQDPEYLAYQNYYLSGLREQLPLNRVLGAPGGSGRSRAAGLKSFSPAHATHVGQYVFWLRNGAQVKVAIDAHDHRNIRSPEILDWADLYFKSNRWPAMHYDPKVRPIVNGNGDLTDEKIRFLTGLRQAEKVYDFVFVSRIWGGGDANVEHNLRLFEKLARVRANRKLLAIFIGFDPADPEFLAHRRRLEQAGVDWTFEHMDYRQLMLLSAQARCTVVRAGISLCIPWRMQDMLCLGACVVLDNHPQPAWPIPLADRQNYFSLDLAIQPDASPAPPQDYAGIVGKMNALLADSAGQQKIRESNRAYFDTVAHPRKVAEYLAHTVLNRAEACASAQVNI